MNAKTKTVPIATKVCQLCSRENESIEHTTNGYRYGFSKSRTWTEDVVQVRTSKGLEVCSGCDAGLRSGTYAAVGVEHEARGHRSGHSFYVAPWAAKIFNRGNNTGRNRYVQGHAMTLAAILKAHVKHSKPLPVEAPEAVPVAA